MATRERARALIAEGEALHPALDVAIMDLMQTDEYRDYVRFGTRLVELEYELRSACYYFCQDKSDFQHLYDLKKVANNYDFYLGVYLRRINMVKASPEFAKVARLWQDKNKAPPEVKKLVAVLEPPKTLAAVLQGNGVGVKDLD